MFKSIVQWHRNWETEVLAVLADPTRAATATPGYRRHTAERLARMSVVERQQTLAFISRFRGIHGYVALGKLLLAFTAVGMLGYLVFPDKISLLHSVIACNALGTVTTLGLISIWFNYRRMPAPSFKSFVLVIALACIGAMVGASVVTLVDGQPLASLGEQIGHIVLFGGFGLGSAYAVVYGFVATWRRKEYEMLTTALQMQAEQDRLARQLSEARLRLLQAQIEPHFLFNTLGAVQQLAQTESPRAADLTTNLITFLRASLGDMRTQQVSLQSEWRLLEAYLKVMKARLGPRLEFRLNLPTALAEICIPSMLVLTLVENAIKHGIEPALRGGRIDVAATREGDIVHIEVCDTGVGESLPAGLGVGLRNLKERVELTYGQSGSFALQTQEPHGMLATLRLPLVSLHCAVTP